MDTAPETPSTDSPAGLASPSWHLLRLVTFIAVAFTLGNAMWAAWDQDVTYDEPFHLAWAQRLYAERNDAREQFRFDSKTPALLPAVALRRVASLAGIRSNRVLRFSTRIPSLLFLALLLLLAAEVSRTSDPATRWIGLLLASLDPNLAAHASIATTDVAYSLVVLAFALVVIGRRPPLPRAILLGAILGIAFAVKFTAVLLVPIAALAILARPSASLKERLADLGAATLSAGLTVTALYLFVGIMEPLRATSFQSNVFASLASWWPSLRLPVPRAVLSGIDASIAHNDGTLWASYVFGEEHRGGVWFYFPAHWLIKTPLALIAGILVGIWRVRADWRNPVLRWLALLFLIHAVYFSFFFATQIGFRFVLPCVGLGCALAARGLRGVHRRWLAAMAVLALIERAPYWSDPIAFTNLLVWPKSRAFWYTADSNLDFGQNRQRVAREGRRLGLPLVLDEATITPGLYVVAANDLTVFGTRQANAWLVQNSIPSILVGFTHFAFDMTADRFNRYLGDARVAPSLERTDLNCQPPLSHPKDGGFAFQPTPGSLEGRLWIVCVRSEGGADLQFTLTAGRVWFGRVTAEGLCDADPLRAGQESWFRIPPAAGSRLCLLESSTRRADVLRKTAGYLTLKAGMADADFREVPAETLRLRTYEPGSQR